MQTLETTRRLGEVDRDLLKLMLNMFYERLAAGDVEGLVNMMTPTVVCFPATTWNHARFPRRIHGREAVREAFQQRHINYVVTNVQIHRVLIDSDEAVVHRTTKLRERGSGVTYTYDSVSFFRFRDGLVTEFSELPDGSAFDAVINFPH